MRRTVPGEFEQQAGIMLNVSRLSVELPVLTLVQMLRLLKGKTPAVLCVENEQQRGELTADLVDWGIPEEGVRILVTGAISPWVRDFGPIFAREADGDLVLLRSGYYRRDSLPAEERFSQQLATLLDLQMKHVPLDVEGGAVLSNGRGLCLTTMALWDRNRAWGLSPKEVSRLFRESYGYEQVLTLLTMKGEPTGHVDMFATFTSPETVVVGQYDPAADPVNAEILDANAIALSKYSTPWGAPNVVRVPMPPNRDGVWRSYTNVIYANGTLLVPDYGPIDPMGFEQARRTYEQLLPGWDVRPVEARQLATYQGSLRCVSCNIPWAPSTAGLFTPATPPPALVA